MQMTNENFDLILDEQDRQIHGLELIASENFVSDKQ
jgi:glycine hydroxymethyltransferase